MSNNSNSNNDWIENDDYIHDDIGELAGSDQHQGTISRVQTPGRWFTHSSIHNNVRQK
jgi:hypothetical protein